MTFQYPVMQLQSINSTGTVRVSNVICALGFLSLAFYRATASLADISPPIDLPMTDLL